MYRVIKVVFTKRPLDFLQAASLKKYKFLCDYEVKAGDMIDSPVYSTPCEVIDVSMEKSIPWYDGKQVKPIIVDTINGKTVSNNKTKTKTNSEMKNNSSMFDGILDSYTSQFMPVKEDGVRLSMSGILCVPVGDKYVGCDANNRLVKFPAGMTIPFPVFSIEKPVSAIVKGDIIKRDRSYAKVLDVTGDGRIRTLSFSGVTTTQAAIEDFLMQQATFRVLINMFNFDQNSGFNPLIYAMCTGEEIDFQGMMMLSMTPQGKNLFANSNINPMMLMMLDKNRGNGGSDAMSMMMMASMFNGSGQNPFANMFGQPQQPAVQPVVQPVAQPAPAEEPAPITTEQAIKTLMADEAAIAQLKEMLKEDK